MSQQKLSSILAYLVKKIIEIIYPVIDIKRRAVFLPNTDLLKSDNSVVGFRVQNSEYEYRQ